MSATPVWPGAVYNLCTKTCVRHLNAPAAVGAVCQHLVACKGDLERPRRYRCKDRKAKDSAPANERGPPMAKVKQKRQRVQKETTYKRQQNRRKSTNKTKVGQPLQAVSRRAAEQHPQTPRLWQTVPDDQGPDEVQPEPSQNE